MNAEQTASDRPARPWYREFYVWLLIAFPALSIAGGVTTLWIAARTNDGLVVDDYYRRGLEINRTFARDRAAAALGLSAAVALDDAGGQIRVALAAKPHFSPPDRITVSFLHATRAGSDHRLNLARSSGLAYTGSLPELPPGRWHVLIEADDWRLVQSVSVDH